MFLQTPEIMQTLSKLSAKLPAQSGRAQMPADTGAAKVEEFCEALLDVSLCHLHTKSAAV